MKQLKAFVRLSKEDAILEALQNTDELLGVTLSEVRGFGNLNHWKDSEMLSPRKYLKIEVVLKKDSVPAVIRIISDIAHSGTSGDGRIFISDIDKSYRISTREYL